MICDVPIVHAIFTGKYNGWHNAFFIVDFFRAVGNTFLFNRAGSFYWPVSFEWTVQPCGRIKNKALWFNDRMIKKFSNEAICILQFLLPMSSSGLTGLCLGDTHCSGLWRSTHIISEQTTHRNKQQQQNKQPIPINCKQKLAKMRDFDIKNWPCQCVITQSGNIITVFILPLLEVLWFEVLFAGGLEKLLLLSRLLY